MKVSTLPLSLLKECEFCLSGFKNSEQNTREVI
jgi:hypothetical protein